VALGENLSGSLNVCPEEDFEVTEVRCEIQCVERARVIQQVYDSELSRTIPKEVEDFAVVFSARPMIAGLSHMAKGENRDFPLSMNFSAGGRPTCRGIDRKVTWTLKGVVAVCDCPDAVSKTTEIQVIPATSQSVIRGKRLFAKSV